ncbi:MAG: undecaprenyl-phosphate glucose phosphotransferase [Bauldia sp.]|nr:undecaprenyl-phosphate glucose phosphotransferase [Bauldia sp.]
MRNIYDSVAGSALGGAVHRPPTATERAELSPGAEAVAVQLSAHTISRRMVGGAVRLLDIVGFALVGFLSFLVYPGIEAGLAVYLTPIVLGPLFVSLLLGLAGGYGVPALRRPVREVTRAIGAIGVILALFAILAFFTKTGEVFSRLWFGVWLFSGIAYFSVSRAGIAGLLKSWQRAGMLERRAVIVGGGSRAETLIDALRAEPGNDVRICGIFDDRRDDRSPGSVAGIPKLGTVTELVAFCRRARVDMLIVSLPITAETRLLQMLRQLWVLPVDIRLSAHSHKLRFRPRSYSFVGGVPFLDVFDRPIADWDAMMKRAFDLLAASLILVLTAPILLLTAIAIKLDSRGPVFFRQKRYGFNNEVIDVLKFRSMHHHLADPHARQVVTRGDPRVTRIGRFIRKTSIDELPQLLNVLSGRLSLVGPRPHAVQAHTQNRLWDEVVDGYFARHRVKPGVTGWAQIHGWRGEVDTPEKIRGRVEHDLYYIENWSILLDLYILVMTPFRLFSSENAY